MQIARIVKTLFAAIVLEKISVMAVIMKLGSMRLLIVLLTVGIAEIGKKDLILEVVYLLILPNIVKHVAMNLVLMSFVMNVARIV